MVAAGLACAQPEALQRAGELYQRTEYRQALELLGLPSSTDPRALLLAGKSWFMLGEFKSASEALEKAAKADPGSSEIQHWLGKAFGRRAETSSFLTAPRYASRCRQSFEKSVELDPNNIEAMNDLLEYYLEAPGMLGGGMEKAEAMAARIGEKDPVERHWALARIAQKRNDHGAAEQHLRRAAELAPQQIGRLIDLARFLARRGKLAESEALFERAASLEPGHPKLLFERAQAYVEGRRNLGQARELLRRYLEAKLTPDDPPREEARRLLEKASGS
jgi:Tfp pilus assembly protein PilF